MEEESLFLKYIRATLKKWVGFQVSEDNQFSVMCVDILNICDKLSFTISFFFPFSVALSN